MQFVGSVNSSNGDGQGGWAGLSAEKMVERFRRSDRVACSGLSD